MLTKWLTKKVNCDENPESKMYQVQLFKKTWKHKVYNSVITGGIGF